MQPFCSFFGVGFVVYDGNNLLVLCSSVLYFEVKISNKKTFVAVIRYKKQEHATYPKSAPTPTTRPSV